LKVLCLISDVYGYIVISADVQLLYHFVSFQMAFVVGDLT